MMLQAFRRKHAQGRTGRQGERIKTPPGVFRRVPPVTLCVALLGATAALAKPAQQQAAPQAQTVQQQAAPQAQTVQQQAATLLQLARDLQTEVHKAGLNTLSLEAVRKAEEIQKLAKDLKAGITHPTAAAK